MSMIEFQAKAASFLAAQQTALRTTPICPKRPISIGNFQVIIDQIEFGNNALRHNFPADFPVLHNSLTSTAPGSLVSGYETLIAQDVIIHITTLNDIVAHPNQPPALIVAVPATLVFNLEYYALPDDCYLRSEFAAFELGQVPPLPEGLAASIDELRSALLHILRASIPTSTVPSGLSKLTTFWAKFINAGVSVDESLQRLAFRAQIGGDNDGVVIQWTNFLQGFFDDRLGGSDWGIFVDSGLITEFVKAEVNSQLSGVHIDSLQLFVGCNYSNADAKALFTLDVEGVYDLPDPFGTIVRDPKVLMSISVDKPNILTLKADYSNVIDVLHSFDIVEFFLPSLSDGIEGFLQLQIGAALADLSKGDDAPYCKKTSSTVAECTKSVRMPQISSGTKASMTHLLALDEGIAFVGTLESRTLTPAIIHTTVGPFAWTPPSISCGQSSKSTVEDFRENAAARSSLRAEVRLEQSGTSPVFVCGQPTVLNDPLGEFPPKAITLDKTVLPATIVITIPEPASAYAAAPYSLDLLVSTTAGMRLVRVPPPPAITPEIINFLTETIAVQLKICDVIVSPWFHGAHTFDVNWIVNPLVDPSPDQSEHLWNIEITGIEERQIVSAASSTNVEIARATAQFGVPIVLSALIPGGGSTDLRISLDPGRRTGPSGDDSVEFRSQSSRSAALHHNGQGIQIRQQKLLREKSFSLDSPCQSLVVSPRFGVLGVVATLLDELVAFNLTNPNVPTRAGAWKMNGVRGACRLGNRLLAFGADGFAASDDAGRLSSIGPRCEPYAIVDAIAGGNVIYVLTTETLEVRCLRLCTIASLPISGGRSLLRRGRRLIVGGRTGLNVYVVSGERQLSLEISRDNFDVSRLYNPPESPSDSFIATLTDGSARLFGTQAGILVEAAAYAQAPWFSGSLQLGRRLMRVDNDRRILTVSRYGESRLVVPATY